MHLRNLLAYTVQDTGDLPPPPPPPPPQDPGMAPLQAAIPVSAVPLPPPPITLPPPAHAEHGQQHAEPAQQMVWPLSSRILRWAAMLASAGQRNVSQVDHMQFLWQARKTVSLSTRMQPLAVPCAYAHVGCQGGEMSEKQRLAA